MFCGKIIRPLAKITLRERYILAQKLWSQWCRYKHYFKSPCGIASIKKLEKFKNIHKKQRCIIIGNGPSLRNMDLSFLRKEITFGLNRIYLLTEELEFDVSYFVVSAPLVMEQFANDIQNKIPCHKFVAFRGHKYFQNDGTVSFFNELHGFGFSDDLLYGIFVGHTVTYAALQIAYYMGFEEVVLIGVDHNFICKGKPNSYDIMKSSDPNHFSENYFSKGIRWQLPDLESSELSYRRAKIAFEGNGRRILDATVDGKLNVFPKIDYIKYFYQSYV